ncbi:hypothetical protein JHK87_000529 [Glycine soja]|nr:hypothetical protein JHK87_000529 [Glycine soja]KAG5087913.1 hypothetical protein JHK86_000525 [Glycine max]
MLPAPRPCGRIGGANIDLFVGGMVAYVFEEVEGVDDGVEVSISETIKVSSLQLAPSSFMAFPAEVEAFALQKSLERIHHMRLSNVVFETDCKMIKDHLDSGRTVLSDLNSILANCK